MSRAKLLVGGAILASLLLVGAYFAAGGASYEPLQTQDPCKPRPWRDPEGLQQIAEQFSLSALDGAACQLGVSRETLAQALASPEAREKFAKKYGIDDEKLAKAIRAGLIRAVDDAEEAGALTPILAVPLRGALEQMPLEEAIELVKDGRKLFEGANGILGPVSGLLEQLLP
ncbi:MAG: hypothetical protein JST31_10635 [Actinobacteria bacterium]|nr:hypothetical protein [Actinomycetota bacterium]